MQSMIRHYNIGPTTYNGAMQDQVQIDSNRHSRRHHDVRFDFKMLVSLMCDELNSGLDQSLDKQRCSIMMFRLPLDPDSDGKQCWDIFFLFLLLYCSFAIPYNIAFVDTSNAANALLDSKILIDAVFIFDILLSFLTGYEDNGLVIREPRLIAINYLRMWFLLDLAGSFFN